MRKIEKIMQIQQKNRCFQAVLLLECGRGRRDRTLGTRFWSGCLMAKSRLITAFSSHLLQIFTKTECF